MLSLSNKIEFQYSISKVVLPSSVPNFIENVLQNSAYNKPSTFSYLGYPCVSLCVYNKRKLNIKINLILHF